MANNYLFTLFLFILLQISFTASGIWQQLDFSSGFWVYLGALALILLLLLYGFTHAVKANHKAKGHSYLCAFISVASALLASLLIVVLEMENTLVFCMAAACFISALRLAHITYKKTKSYFQ